MLIETQWRLYYQPLHRPLYLVGEIEEVCPGSRGGRIGVRALNNIKVDLPSRCNHSRPQRTGHSCEAAFALLVELSGRAFRVQTMLGEVTSFAVDAKAVMSVFLRERRK